MAKSSPLWWLRALAGRVAGSPYTGLRGGGRRGGLLLARALAAPDEAGTPPRIPGPGVRVQSVLAQLLLREAGLSTRHDPLALTAAEVNAFLAARPGPGRAGMARPGPDRGGRGGAQRGDDARPTDPGGPGLLGRGAPARVDRRAAGLGCGAGPGGGGVGRPRGVPGVLRRDWDARRYLWPCYGGSWAVAPRPWCGECPGSSSGWKASPAASSSIPVPEGRAGPRRAKIRASGLRAAPG